MFRAIHYRTLNIGFLYYSSFRGKNYMPQHLLLFERKRELSVTLFTVRRVSAVGGTMKTICVNFDIIGR